MRRASAAICRSNPCTRDSRRRNSSPSSRSSARAPSGNSLSPSSSDAARRVSNAPVPFGDAMPYSSSRACSWLRCAVTCFTASCRARCTCWTCSCSTDFTSTKRIVGRIDASTIASASATSFLFDFTYGFTNCGLSSTGRCPSRCARRAQWCAPPQLSIATTQPRGNADRYVCKPAHRSRRRSTTSPSASTAVRWNTRFAKSIPTRVTFSIGPLRGC